MWRTLIQDYDGEQFPAKLRSVQVVADYQVAKSMMVIAQKEPYSIPELLDRVTRLGTLELNEGPLGSTAAYLNDISLRHDFAVTEEAHMALVPCGTQPGDVLCAIQGCPVPVVLRRIGKEYLYWGDAFVHGVMSGEATKEGSTWLTIR